MAIVWTPALAVGVNEIDEQHKKLFVMIGNLVKAMETGKGKDEIGNTIKFLEDYVVVHFGHEERLMARHSYPTAATHKAQHAAFVADFVKLKSEIEQQGPSSFTVIQVMQRVTNWLVDHIGKTDKNLGAFLQTKS